MRLVSGAMLGLAAAAAPIETAAQSLVFLPVGSGYDSQLGGPYPPAPGVQIVSRDRAAKPAPGLYSICYFNAFQTQAEDADWWREHHGELLLKVGGRPLEDEDWPGEFLLDTSTKEKRDALAGIFGVWIDDCAQAGFSAVEPDNLDSFSRSGGRLSMADNLALARLLSDRAHAVGLAVAQKNAAEIGRDGRVAGDFDFAIVEECEAFRECEAFETVYGDQMIEIEYADADPAVFARACAARGARIPIVLRDRDLARPGDEGYRFDTC